MGSPTQVPALARRLAALPERTMRSAVLAERLAELPLQDATTLASEIVRRAPTGRPYDVAMMALTDVLDVQEGKVGLPYERRAAIYALARERDDILLVRLMISPVAAPDGEPALAPIPGRSEVTLGERKSLARTRDRQLLDRMLRDSDPTVLSILLENPRITEADVVRLAARRPTTPEAQRTLFRAGRFRARYMVRRALVLNPWTPSDLAAQLAGLLTEPDLRRVMNDTQLPDQVRAAARAQLALISALKAGPPDRKQS